MAGREQEIQTSTSTRETALSDENTQQAKSTSYTVEDAERYTATDVRYRQFLECTVMTVRNSTPLPPFIGKVNFLPKHKFQPVERYVVDWSKYYREPEADPQELKPIVSATTEVSMPAEEPKIQPKKKGLLSAGGITASTKVEDKTKTQEPPTAQTEEISKGREIIEALQNEAQKETVPEEELVSATPNTDAVSSDEEEIFTFTLD